MGFARRYINLETDQAPLGTLLITDAQLLVRPPVAGQYPASARHNTAHAYRLLELGNDEDRFTWHIATPLGPQAANQMLDDVFRYYLDACCMGQWCDARVTYLDASGNTVVIREHGMADGQYTMDIRVYCNTPDATPITERLIAQIRPNEPVVMVRPGTTDSDYRVEMISYAEVALATAVHDHVHPFID